MLPCWKKFMCRFAVLFVIVQVYFIEKGLKVLETMVGKDNDNFCVGSELTFADLCFVPQMFASRRFGANLAKFPKCNRLFEELLKLEVFRHTHPNNQPDTRTNCEEPDRCETYFL